jgi:putative tricarboxylic transport membrane protein
MEQKQAQDLPHRGLTYNMAEAIVAISIFFIGVVMMIDGYRVGMGWAFDGPMAGYFPFRTGALICISSFVVFLRTVSGTHRNYKAFVTWGRFKLVLKVLVPTILYVLLTQFVGIYVASALFTAGFMRMNDRFGWPKIMLISVSASATLFLMFEVWFKVPLPKGPLESLLLGY